VLVSCALMVGLLQHKLLLCTVLLFHAMPGHVQKVLIVSSRSRCLRNDGRFSWSCATACMCCMFCACAPPNCALSQSVDGACERLQQLGNNC
jgi:hypothetical protein